MIDPFDFGIVQQDILGSRHQKVYHLKIFPSSKEYTPNSHFVFHSPMDNRRCIAFAHFDFGIAHWGTKNRIVGCFDWKLCQEDTVDIY
jgi:hypothetical protein